MNDFTKRAAAYSLLAHIRNSGTLSKGPLDIFVPIVKKALHFISTDNDQNRGENINEIRIVIENHYGIDFPLSVLQIIIKQIAQEINKKETLLILNNDNSFWIKNYTFEDYDQKLNECQIDVNNLQNLFKQFCEANAINTKENYCIIKFIERHKISLSQYLSNKVVSNGKSYVIEAKFIEHFKNNMKVYNQIKSIYLGSMLTSYLDYQPSKIKMNVDLLLDTNFIVSLIDLNTPESTHTCRKLLDVSKKLGYTFHILSETLEEIEGLINYKISNFDKSIIQKYINKEDIYNACERKKLNKSDLDKIIDNLEDTVLKFGIQIIPQTDKLKNKAKFSQEYNLLKKYRNTEKAALHDAMCIIYVKDKRGNKKIKKFEKVNCWFVNNAISHDNDNEVAPLINSKENHSMPNVIKVDDLLNVLWLSHPDVNISDINNDILDIGLTSLVAFSLNESLPKARIIKELDENIQKYRNEDITDRDIFLLSTRIVSGQVKQLESLNELASSDVSSFNQRVKEEAQKQELIEKEKYIKFEEVIKKLEESVSDIENVKTKLNENRKNEISYLENREAELALRENQSEKILNQKDEIIKKLQIGTIQKENEIRQNSREKYIKEELKKWRRRSFPLPIIMGVSLLCGFFWIYNSCNGNLSETSNKLEELSQNKILAIVFCIVITVLEFILGRLLYDKYYNHSNINAYISKIKIPDIYKKIEYPKL